MEEQRRESVTPAGTSGKWALTAPVTDTSHLSRSMLSVVIWASACQCQPGSIANPSVEVEYDNEKADFRDCDGLQHIRDGARRTGSGGTSSRSGHGNGPGGPGGGSAVTDPAQFLLSHTGELKLTDAQVTRLAGIARRSAEQRRALRAQMDSIRPEGMRGERPDSATRARMRQRFDQLRPQMERLRTQSQTDRRDAIAILTPDQQAQAWERIARMGRGGGGDFRAEPAGLRACGRRAALRTSHAATECEAPARAASRVAQLHVQGQRSRTSNRPDFLPQSTQRAQRNVSLRPLRALR